MSEPRLDRAVRGIGEATSLVFLAAVALTFYEVILRYFFNAPTTWVHEVSIFLTAAAFIIAGSYTLQRKDHIRISLVFDMLPARGRRGQQLRHHPGRPGLLRHPVHAGDACGAHHVPRFH